MALSKVPSRPSSQVDNIGAGTLEIETPALITWGIVTLAGAVFASPEYAAVIAWLPMPRLLIEYVAVPPLRLTVASGVAPSLKVTLLPGTTVINALAPLVCFSPAIAPTGAAV